MLFVAACGMISGITGIDVDRDYLQSIAIILQSFFSYLMIPGILAAVWEAVRHWYVQPLSFQEALLIVLKGLMAGTSDI